jgi:hypothetical protein
MKIFNVKDSSPALSRAREKKRAHHMIQHFYQVVMG